MSNRKQLLATIRKGNYAHAGEEQAIDLCLNLIAKNSNQLVLDVGCGLGGTADYIEKQGYGKVVGIDIDADILQQAKKLYPQITFHCLDANLLPTLFKDQKFDVICAMNAFFCFSLQQNCLQAFSEVAGLGAHLLLFDYSSPNTFSKTNPFLDQTGKSTAAARFLPINLAVIDKMLNNANWQLCSIINLNDEYKDWYQDLLNRMQQQKEELINLFGLITFQDLYQSFCRLLSMIENGDIGGALVHAVRK